MRRQQKFTAKIQVVRGKLTARDRENKPLLLDPGIWREGDHVRVVVTLVRAGKKR